MLQNQASFTMNSLMLLPVYTSNVCLSISEQVAFFSHKVRTYDVVTATNTDQDSIADEGRIDKEDFLV